MLSKKLSKKLQNDVHTRLRVTRNWFCYVHIYEYLLEQAKPLGKKQSLELKTQIITERS